MKYAAIFAFVAFAFLAQANARSVFANDSLERGAIANALKAKLDASKQKLDKFKDKASEKLKAKLVQAEKKAEKLIEKLKQGTGKIYEEVYVAAEKLISKIEKIEDKYLSHSQNHKQKAVEDEAQTTEAATEEVTESH